METGNDGADEESYGESARICLHPGLDEISSRNYIVGVNMYKDNSTKQDDRVWYQGAPHAICGSVHHGLLEISAMFSVRALSGEQSGVLTYPIA